MKNIGGIAAAAYASLSIGIITTSAASSIDMGARLRVNPAYIKSIKSPNKLTRSFGDALLQRELVSGRVISVSGTMHYEVGGKDFDLHGCVIQTESGKIYAGANHGQDMPKVGDNVTAMLGYAIRPEVVAQTAQGIVPYRTLVAHTQQ